MKQSTKLRRTLRNRSTLKALACGLALAGLLVGCSEEKKEAETEKKRKGVVEQASSAVSQQAVQYINKPLDKAHDSQTLQNAQNQNMQNILEQQPSGEKPQN